MNLLYIIESGLKAKGFDGLANESCGCLCRDLAPGNCLQVDCLPAYKHVHSVTGVWILHESKTGITDEHIEALTDENS